MLQSQDVESLDITLSGSCESSQLSFSQKKVWLINYFAGGDASYNMPMSFSLEGYLNIAALEKSIYEVIKRHDCLRAEFFLRNGALAQVVKDSFELNIPLVDVRMGDVKKYIDCYSTNIFDLSKAPLIKVLLLRLSLNNHILFINTHHIISDGWSIEIFNRELSTFYESYSRFESTTLPLLPLRYMDFVNWQKKWLSGKQASKQADYWVKKLKSSPMVLNMPTDRLRTAVTDRRGRRYDFTLPIDLSIRLQQLSAERKSTLYILLFAAFIVLLSKYSNQNDICVGSVTANRRNKNLENLIGYFANEIALRFIVQKDGCFIDILKEFQITAVEAFENQDLPFEYLLEILGVEKYLSSTPLCQYGFALLNVFPQAFSLSGLEVCSRVCDTYTSKYELTMVVMESPAGLSGIVEYSTSLYDEDMIRRFCRHYQILLEEIVGKPDKKIHDLQILIGVEENFLRKKWNSLEREHTSRSLAFELFEAHARCRPDSLALMSSEGQLTYGELNNKSNQLAAFISDLGMKSEVRVGLFMDKSPEMLIGFWGILKAGGVCVPIDPNDELRQSSYVIETSDLSFLITKSSLVSRIVLSVSLRVIDLGSRKVLHTLGRYSGENSSYTRMSIYPSSLACIIYRNRYDDIKGAVGVEVTHDALAGLALNLNCLYKVSVSSRFLQAAPISSYVALWEVVIALTNGCSLCIAQDCVRYQGKCLTTRMNEYKVTHANIPVRALHNLMPKKFTQLCAMNVFGKRCSEVLARRWFRYVQFAHVCEDIEVMGSSVTTTYLAEGSAMHLRRALIEGQAYILDEYFNLVPFGVVGELYLSGSGLFRGYHNDSTLTHCVLVPNPFSDKPGDLLYKSGKLVRCLPSGVIEYVGSVDNCVFVKGLPIEENMIQKVEDLLAEHPFVKDSIVVLEKTDSGKADRILLAYVLFYKRYYFNIEQKIKSLKRWVWEFLPQHLMPSDIIFVENFPLTLYGEVDFGLLPKASQVHAGSKCEAFKCLERELVEVCEEILGRVDINATDSFFEIGGNSLLALKLASMISEKYSIELPAVTVLRKPIISDIATEVMDTISL